MKRLLTSSILFVVVFTAVPTLVSADDIRNSELNFFVAGSIYTKNRFVVGFPQTVTPFPGEFRLDDTFSGGVRFNVNTTRHWGEEIFFNFEPNNANFFRQSTVPFDQSFDIGIYNFGVNVMYYFTEDELRKTQPFLSAGIGASLFVPTADAKEAARDPLRGNLPNFGTSAKFAFNYGLGVKQMFNDTFGVRVDARGFLSPFPHFGLTTRSTNPSAIVFPIHGALQHFEGSAGIFFRFR